MADAYRTSPAEPVDAATSSQLTGLIRNVVALFSAGAGAIHFAVIQSHFEEYWVFGVFFAVLAWLQILWAILIAARPTRSVALMGAILNGAAVAVWVLTRTVGVPLGPEAGSPEEAEFIDVVATVFEVLAVIGALALLFPRSTRRPVARGAILSSTLVWALAISWVTSAAIVSFTPHEEEATHEADEQMETDDHEEEEEQGAASSTTR